jgi:hypothetical protein
MISWPSGSATQVPVSDRKLGGLEDHCRRDGSKPLERPDERVLPSRPGFTDDYRSLAERSGRVTRDSENGLNSVAATDDSRKTAFPSTAARRTVRASLREGDLPGCSWCERDFSPRTYERLTSSLWVITIKVASSGGAAFALVECDSTCPLSKKPAANLPCTLITRPTSWSR